MFLSLFSKMSLDDEESTVGNQYLIEARKQINQVTPVVTGSVKPKPKAVELNQSLKLIVQKLAHERQHKEPVQATAPISPPASPLKEERRLAELLLDIVATTKVNFEAQHEQMQELKQLISRARQLVEGLEEEKEFSAQIADSRSRTSTAALNQRAAAKRASAGTKAGKRSKSSFHFGHAESSESEGG